MRMTSSDVGECTTKLLPRSEEHDTVTRYEGELDESERDGVPEAGHDRFARVGGEGGGEVPEGTEENEACVGAEGGGGEECWRRGGGGGRLGRREGGSSLREDRREEVGEGCILRVKE